MNRSALPRAWSLVAAGIASAAVFLSLTLPHVLSGSVTGTGQDEWYNVIRGLTALYENLNPSYFIHPALYYELLAVLYGLQDILLRLAGDVGAGTGFLDYFLVHQGQFLDLARYASVGCGTVAVLAAVWFGAVLSGVSGGLLAGVIVASLPLLQTLATSIRVDALALAALLAAAALVVRWHRSPDRRSLMVAAVGIGVAAAANYPGALLLILVGWFEWIRPGDDPLPLRVRRFASACALAFATFLMLNPYVLIDLPTFLRWFTFTAKVPVLIHPHAEEPNPWRYLTLLREQGLPVMLACLTGVGAISMPRKAWGAIGAFGLASLVAFSAMRTQYDRFALPGITLLAIAGASWACAQVSRRIGPRTSMGFALVAGLLVVWSATASSRAEVPTDEEPDYRAEMFDWIAENVPSSATLVLESDTLPLLQTVYDPGVQGRPFQTGLKEAFEALYPDLVRKIVKAQFIAAIYNYDAALLQSDEVYFLASSQNREFIAANRAVLAEPAAFYDALDAGATVVHEAGGFHERLLLYTPGGE